MRWSIRKVLCLIFLASTPCLAFDTMDSDIETIMLKHQSSGDPEVHLNHLRRKILEDPNDGLLLFEYGLALLESADTYHWEFLDQALSYFQKAAEHFPDNPFILMLKGRALGAKALDMKPSVLSRLRWAREAFKLMDRAVEKDPDSPILRLLRADAQLMAHPILRRGDKLKQDAQKIEGWMISPEFKSWPGTLQARFHLFIGCYLEKLERSEQQVLLNWERAVALDPQSRTAAEATARIAGTWVDLGFDGKE
jgi:tetratricopeptide (TPR) repeat protein